MYCYIDLLQKKSAHIYIHILKMSWDDDNEMFGGSANANDDTVLMDAWDAEEEVLMDSWDTPEGEKKVEEKKAPAKKANAAANNKKTNNRSKEPVLLEIDTLDDQTRKDVIKRQQLKSDLNNAADLFDGLGLNDHPKSKKKANDDDDDDFSLLRKAAFTKETPIENHPLFKDAETKKDYQDLRKALSTAITSMNEKSALNYSSNLAIDLIRDVAKPMSVESIRQTIATLNVLMKDKEREERRQRLARVKGGTATGGAGKKKVKAKANLGGAFKKDQEFDIGGDADNFDDFGDDDFM